ncbi:MAG: hypothetical protein V2I54_14005 [Bacteroidales bacterium]|nr:hypothetical protein [Bacteroidales bacterium]
MNFGKNRVQYNDFYWSYFRFDDYDVYFNQEGETIARYTGDIAHDAIKQMEQQLNHTLHKKLIFIVYNRFNDFKQSNIGLVTGKEEYNTGGITRIRNNKVSLYFQGDHEAYRRQLKNSVAEAIVLEMIYGNRFTDNFAGSTMLDLPEWYVKGLSSYLSCAWDTEIDNRVKDGITYQRYNQFNRLTGEEATYAGHSFWKYIHDFYGHTVITDILYFTRINKGVNNAFLQVLGLPFRKIIAQWLDHYELYYKNQQFTTDSIDQQHNIIFTSQPQQKITQVKLSPDGKKLAYIMNELGRYSLFIYDEEADEHHRIYRNGHKIKQITDYTYPILEWHPSGKYLTIITEEKRNLRLIQYNLEEKEFTSRNLLYFDKILSFDYAEKGAKLILSAAKEGKTNLFTYDLASSTSTPLTQDGADHFNPNYILQSNEMVYSSNQPTDTFPGKRYSSSQDLYLKTLVHPDNQPQNLTKTFNINEILPTGIQPDHYLYLSNQNGIYNLHKGIYDSTITHIDTAIHYRYFINQKALTNLGFNILTYDFNPNTSAYAMAYYQKGSYHIYNSSISDSLFTPKGLLKETWFIQKNTDSLQVTHLKKGLTADSLNIHSPEDNYVDTDHYTFETEKPYFKKKYDPKTTDTTGLKQTFPKIRIYERTFYTDHIISQVDFGFLNNTYQAFTGGAVYFNPGFNALLKFGTYDLLEDYKIIAGVRFSADFNSNEYLLSLENLKRRVDEQIVFHRQVFENITNDFVSKTKTHKLMYIRTIPYSQIHAIKGTLTLRHDQQIFMATDRSTMQTPDIHQLWGGIKLDYIFDNTINTGINLYNGTRYKIFGEYYNQVNETKGDLFVLGADFRHYQKLHRDLIFASRFAASTSFGNRKLIYYLGGVDNWTNFSRETPTFIPLEEIPISHNEEYAYQAVATNLRGFPQNIRNGNSFALINTELRWPLVRYFSNNPLNSSFWNNLQLVGFFDMGTAWSGISPYAKENAYDEEVINRGPITITLDTERDPIVAGYGFGLRAMIFGYFARFDWAWGIENQQITPGIFYFSLSLDF